MIWDFNGVIKVSKIFFVLCKFKIDIYIFHLGTKCINNIYSIFIFKMFNDIQNILLKRSHWPRNLAYRKLQVTLIETLLKTDKWRQPTLCRQVNKM